MRLPYLSADPDQQLTQAHTDGHYGLRDQTTADSHAYRGIVDGKCVEIMFGT